MENLRTLLQSPRGLIIFEAAARLGSFTRAAQELNMQQPSVSAAIKQLESNIGVALFLREHRRVAPTTAGQKLYITVAKSLSDIQASLAEIRRSDRAQYVTISTSSAFSYHWLMPRLHLLYDQHPDIDLRMQNSVIDPDLDDGVLDLGIRLGNGTWTGYSVAKIADEIIYPVASPQVMAASKNLRSIPNLMHERLIHLEEPIRDRPTWPQWFAHHKIANADLGTGLRLNDYTLVLQAAMSGAGFAFGWDHIVRPLLAQKTLVARDDWGWTTGNGIYVLWSENRPLSDPAKIVRDWIVSQAQP